MRRGERRTSFGEQFVINHHAITHVCGVICTKKRSIVQGVKDKIGLKASDVAQGLKICIHGQFHTLN